MKTITSIKEDSVVEARSLQTSKGRISSQKCLVEGEEQIAWALENFCHVLHVFVHDKQKEHPLIAILKHKKIPIYLASDGVLRKITDTAYLVPFVAVATCKETGPAISQDFVIVLDGLKDQGNIGTIVRTAEAFDVNTFISTSEDLDLFYKKTIDASRGAVFSSKLHRFKSGKEAVESLKRQGYQIVVTTIKDSTLQSFVKIEDKPLAIVFGNETSGVSQEVEDAADIKIHIPMSGSMESLNVGVAAGISLYEIKIKWILAMLSKKIKESLGRDLYLASKWIRLVFDVQLKKATSFHADEAIIMMILHMEGLVDEQRVTEDAGLASKDQLKKSLEPLLKKHLIVSHAGKLSLTDKGQEAISQIWTIHELTENLVFKGVSEHEKEVFLKVIHKMHSNCEEIVPFS